MSSRKEKMEASLDFVRRTTGALVQRRDERQVGKALWGWLRLSKEAGDKQTRFLAKSKGGRPRQAVLLPDSTPKGANHSPGTWSESFIFAGGSAFLLLLAILFPDYWYVSFFALTPFLYRTLKATPGECMRLGLLFGFFFFGGSTISTLVTSPFACMVKLFSGIAIFTLFGWSVGWARQRWGFNPFVLVFLWVGLELGLLKLGFVGGILGKAGFSHPIFGSLVTIFGCLTVSATIVLFNSLLVLAIVKNHRISVCGWRVVNQDKGVWSLLSESALSSQRVYLVPESRAPPIKVAT